MAIAVSVVVPAYNASRTMERCIESLLGLAESSPVHEIIIVDNGSDDDTAEIIRKYAGITLVEEKAVRGPSAARNAGVRAATGEIIALPHKRWKASVWECLGLAQSGLHDAATSLTGKSAAECMNAKLDFLHRLGRKNGMIVSAWRAGQNVRW